MPKFATIEDAPHHLKLVNDYGKTVVTLSLALLSLSVAFAEKLLKPPVDLIQSSLLIAFWIGLFLALIAGLMIVGFVIPVASNYVKGLQVAYPDALEVISKGHRIKIGEQTEEIEITDPKELKEIGDALTKSGKRGRWAYNFARISFVMIGLSSLSIASLGVYTIIYRGIGVDASSAVDSSLAFVMSKYKVIGEAARFRSLAYEERDKSYSVKIGNQRVPKEEYVITISSSSGDVIKAAKTP